MISIKPFLSFKLSILVDSHFFRSSKKYCSIGVPQPYFTQIIPWPFALNPTENGLKTGCCCCIVIVVLAIVVFWLLLHFIEHRPSELFAHLVRNSVSEFFVLFFFLLLLLLLLLLSSWHAWPSTLTLLKPSTSCQSASYPNNTT